jgi:hypothetical protein
MSAELEQKKKQLQELLLRIPVSGSYASVSLTRQVSQLTTEIEQQERQEQEARLREQIARESGLSR